MKLFNCCRDLHLGHCDSDPKASVTLVQPVGGLPLAIRLMGGYLAAAGSSLFVHAAFERFDVLTLLEGLLSIPGEDRLQSTKSDRESLTEDERGQLLQASFARG